jgi:hypothetical protein
LGRGDLIIVVVKKWGVLSEFLALPSTALVFTEPEASLRLNFDRRGLVIHGVGQILALVGSQVESIGGT